LTEEKRLYRLLLPRLRWATPSFTSMSQDLSSTDEHAFMLETLRNHAQQIKQLKKERCLYSGLCLVIIVLVALVAFLIGSKSTINESEFVGRRRLPAAPTGYPGDNPPDIMTISLQRFGGNQLGEPDKIMGRYNVKKIDVGSLMSGIAAKFGLEGEVTSLYSSIGPGFRVLTIRETLWNVARTEWSKDTMNGDELKLLFMMIPPATLPVAVYQNDGLNLVTNEMKPLWQSGTPIQLQTKTVRDLIPHLQLSPGYYSILMSPRFFEKSKHVRLNYDSSLENVAAQVWSGKGPLCLSYVDIPSHFKITVTSQYSTYTYPAGGQLRNTKVEWLRQFLKRQPNLGVSDTTKLYGKVTGFVLSDDMELLAVAKQEWMHSQNDIATATLFLNAK